MRKIMRFIPTATALLFLAGCVPSMNEQTEIVDDPSQSDEEKTIIPSMQIDESFYRTLLPYKESEGRGLVVQHMYSKYDIEEVEKGLMRLSKRTFSPSDYYFQEGQMIKREKIVEWVQRKAKKYPGGLNDNIPEGLSQEEIAKQREQKPIYLAHIVEQDYLTKSSEDKVKLAGVSIGLAMNSIYYYQKEEYGATYEKSLSQDAIEKKGKAMANEIVKRMREMDGLKDIPITVGLFKQEPRNSIVPGTYFSYGVAEKGKASIGDWKPINEEYVLFPQPTEKEKYREYSTYFNNFKQDIDKYFSNYTSVIGKAYYRDDEIQKLTIDIPIQYNGDAELIGFMQYMSGLVVQHFPASLNVDVNVTSINGPEALLTRESGKEEPYVHIYD